jgi:hypothetical protein
MNETENVKPEERSSLSISKVRRDEFEELRVTIITEKGRVVTQDEALGIIIAEAKERRSKK